MTGRDLNPYLRTTGKSGWYWVNHEPHVACDQRIFVILENSALLTFYDLQGKSVSNHILEPDDIVFFGAGTPYFFDNATAEHFRYICLSYDLTQEYAHLTVPTPCGLSCFEKDEIVDKPFWGEGQQIDGHRFPLLIRKNAVLRGLTEKIWEESYRKLPYHEEKCSAFLKEMLTDALRRTVDEEAELADSIPLATAILHHIDSRFQYPVTVQELAQEMHYHPYYITRVFSMVYGTTPYQYLTQCRVNKARSLLTNTDFSIGDIALRCGFVNISHFSAAMRRITGKSPTEIRRQ